MIFIFEIKLINFFFPCIIYMASSIDKKKRKSKKMSVGKCGPCEE